MLCKRWQGYHIGTQQTEALTIALKRQIDDIMAPRDKIVDVPIGCIGGLDDLLANERCVVPIKPNARDIVNANRKGHVRPIAQPVLLA
ncbi:hypothetical protein GCM10025858_23190 [Alicyclobacillus sacchari]|nr:hypothetical protein GCM10025858_23190 [Alicyclobacillus sacchari]